MRGLTDKEKKWVEDALKKIENKMIPVTERNRDKIPYTTVNGRFDDKTVDDPCWWTNGFWGGDKYLDAALKLLMTLDEKRCSWGTDTDNILNNCAVDYHSDGHNMSIIYGDYYFIEAVMKLAGKDLPLKFRGRP